MLKRILSWLVAALGPPADEAPRVAHPCWVCREFSPSTRWDGDERAAICDRCWARRCTPASGRNYVMKTRA